MSTVLNVNLGEHSYEIFIGNGMISKAADYFSLNRRVLIVTDDGVPESYSKLLSSQCKYPYVFTVKQGEASKTISSFDALCSFMMENNFSRKDCVVAVGGGMVGDLSGFAAASYMRGIDFYNIPTTVLSMVDSSVGGKTGVNLSSIKNIVGAFKQPRAVIIDPELTKTLPSRQISNGLAEAIKMSLTFDKDLFDLFEDNISLDLLEQIIIRSLKIKINVVEQDEKESGLRKVLNFGHTVGHGIESLGMGYYHGECVALGMIPMCSDNVRKRLIPVLERINLPTYSTFDREKVLNAIYHDKKAINNAVSCVFVNEIGSYELKNISFDELSSILCLPNMV